MRPREMKGLKKPEVPASHQVYEGAPLTVPVRIETPPAAAGQQIDQKELQELKDGLGEAKEQVATAEAAVSELNSRASELQQALSKSKHDLEEERNNNLQKIEELTAQVATLEQQLEEATEPTQLPELEEITVKKIDKTKVANGNVMLLCELQLSPEPYGEAKAIVALTNQQVKKIKELGGGNGGSKR